MQTCKQRHLPPTGKKCQLVKEKDANSELLRDAAVSSGATESQMTPGKSTDGQLVQMKILEQLKRVTDRLDQVEDRMAPSHELSIDSFLENVPRSKKVVKKQRVVNDSSSEDSDTPSLELLRSQHLQKKVDKRIRDLDQCSQFPGKDTQSLIGGVGLILLSSTKYTGPVRRFFFFFFFWGGG